MAKFSIKVTGSNKVHPKSYRRDDKPLFDTGMLMNGLRGEITKTFNGVRIGLIDSVGYGLKHQEGFVNKAPFPIPLTRRAANILRKGGFKTMEQTGLKEGKDFILQYAVADTYKLGVTDNDDLISVDFENIKEPVFSTQGGAEPAAMIYQGTIATITATLIKWDTARKDIVLGSIWNNANGVPGTIGQRTCK